MKFSSLLSVYNDAHSSLTTMAFEPHTSVGNANYGALSDSNTSALNGFHADSYPLRPSLEALNTSCPHQPSRTSPVANDDHQNDKVQSSPTLGKPCQKRSIDWKDITALAISLTAFALAVASVASNTVAWRLGIVYQLVVTGFLLSMMNLCLTTVTPFLFLLLEARWGASILQNYNGILGSQIFNSDLGLTWRVTFCILSGIPIGLSVAYKLFVGGQSSMMVHADALVDVPSVFGWVCLPGLHNTGVNTGITLFSNATQPYAAASAPRVNSTTGALVSEPEVPEESQAYGANLLVMSNTSSAMLDLPQSNYLLALQRSLAVNETYTLKANIHGTVAKLNETFHERRNSSLFYTYCVASSTYPCCKMMYNFFGIDYFPNDGIDIDQSAGFIGFLPYGDNVHLPTCGGIRSYFKQYSVARYPCFGVWNVTKSSIRLVKGHCEKMPLPPNGQLFITQNELALVNWYLPLLVEFLGQFSQLRPYSPWYNVSTATAMAAVI